MTLLSSELTISNERMGSWTYRNFSGSKGNHCQTIKAHLHPNFFNILYTSICRCICIMSVDSHIQNYPKSPEWNDDKKANVLFAPFRERSLNPHSWDRKMKFWSSAVEEFVKSNNLIFLNLQTLPGYFQRNNREPKCLETVLTEMLR